MKDYHKRLWAVNKSLDSHEADKLVENVIGRVQFADGLGAEL
ncbi:MAG: hypothetical protein R3C68_10120 [Myxococcota bacterium]